MIRLHSIEIFKHSFFKPQKFDFVNDKDSKEGPYVTLLIGPNGTGKSQVLELIIEIFNILAASQEKRKKVQNFKHDFQFIYFIDSDEIKFRSIKNEDEAWLNKKPIDFFQIPLPKKFLASAINLTDRFPNLTKSRKIYNKSYEYLGIRAASNNAFINTHIKNLITRFTIAISDQTNLNRFKILFNHLNLKQEIGLTLMAGPRLKLDRKNGGIPDYLTSQDKLEKYFREYISKMKTQNKMTIRYENYLRLINDKSYRQKVIDFVSSNQNLFNKKRKGDIKYHIQVKFSDASLIHQFLSEAEQISFLGDLDLLVFEKLSLQRIDTKYSFDQASSGEHHILSSFISMLATIQKDSVVMVDEPEISLHPNWQIQYMNLLQSAFSDFQDCHFIISTHSHFLVTDLVPNKSTIISFSFDAKGTVENETITFETHGWSTENILYRVFGVSSVRNHYLEMDVRNLLSLISSKSQSPKDFVQMARIIKSLKQFKLTPSDPLVGILETAEKYLSANAN
jgi:predicted ATPase